jgi:hypothetical protein
MHAELAFNAVDKNPTESIWPSDHFGLFADLAITPRSF